MPVPLTTPVDLWGIGGCNCSCSTTICVVLCGVGAISGASVTILSGGMTIAGGTTGGGGCVTLSIPSAGTYTVQVVVGGTMVHNASHSLTCGGTLTISTAPGVACCGGCPIPMQNVNLAFSPDWAMGAGAPIPSCTLIWNGVATFPGANWTICMCWSTGDPTGPCATPGTTNNYWLLTCPGGVTGPPTLTTELDDYPNCGSGGGSFTPASFVSCTQSPFQLVFTMTFGGFKPVTYTCTITP